MSEAFNKAWDFLKTLPEQQLFTNMGTIHPAALAMARREQANKPPGSVQIQRLERPEYGIQERTGSPEPTTWDKRNVEDIKTYDGFATGHWDKNHPDFRIKPNYPPRDPIYFDTPLNLEGGYQ